MMVFCWLHAVARYLGSIIAALPRLAFSAQDMHSKLNYMAAFIVGVVAPLLLAGAVLLLLWAGDARSDRKHRVNMAIPVFLGRGKRIVARINHGRTDAKVPLRIIRYLKIVLQSMLSCGMDEPPTSCLALETYRSAIAKNFSHAQFFHAGFGQLSLSKKKRAVQSLNSAQRGDCI
jgi:hypothetical protein